MADDMDRWYISKNYKNLTQAGNKAKTDVEQIMAGLGFRNAGLPRTTVRNKVAGFFITLAGVIKAPFCWRKGDLVVLQYPLKKYYSFLCRLARRRGCRVVTLIHDLGSFRRQKLTVEEEIRRLNRSHYIIAHNDSMKRWLVAQGCRAEVGCLEIFDYLSPEANRTVRKAEPPYGVVYAGALSPRKNNFLYRLGEYIQSYRFVLYGSGFEPDKAQRSERFDYRGFIPSDRLIVEAEGHFGLVWDGAEIDTCSGNFGEYLQYNNPHKTSLYLRCGLPVIIWDKAALAPFVRQNGIGLTVSSLADIEGCLARLSPQEYAAMVDRVKEVGERLAAGYYFGKAIAEAQRALYPAGT